MKSLRQALENKKRQRENENGGQSELTQNSSLHPAKYLRKGDLNRAEEERLSKVAVALTVHERKHSEVSMLWLIILIDLSFELLPVTLLEILFSSFLSSPGFPCE